MSETTVQEILNQVQGTHRKLDAWTVLASDLAEKLPHLQRGLLEAIQLQGPSLGLCSSDVASWIMAGKPPRDEFPTAILWAHFPKVGTVPLCLRCFEGMIQVGAPGSQLVQADGPLPSGGLVVPGAFRNG